MSKPKFEVDPAGLAKLLERRGKAFAIFELIQNAWDTAATDVSVTLGKPKGGYARLVVEDNDPDGFHDLSHAYTLFAESAKKSDPTKRGRFNLGEKLVLAMCRWAEVRSTKGTIRFNEDGTREHLPKATDAGSVFEAEIRMTAAEYQEVRAKVETLIVPEASRTTFNGAPLPTREPVATFSCTLPTMISDEEGNLSRTRRKTEVRVYEPGDEEEPMIYELGIPVVGHDGRFHVDVQQKVPVNLDRDNVPPAYLRKVRAEVLNATHALLSEDDASETWVNDALGHKDVSDEAVDAAITGRYGEKRFVWDPTDVEANHRLTAEGHKCIAGGAFGKDAWKSIKRSGAVQRAGEISPTPKPDADDADHVPPEKWTQGMHEVTELVSRLGHELLECDVKVAIIYGRGFEASYRKGHMTFYFEVLGRRWFDDWRTKLARTLDLICHELAHHYESNHLSDGYYHALSDLAGRMTVLALEKPELFDIEGAP